MEKETANKANVLNNRAKDHEKLMEKRRNFTRMLNRSCSKFLEGKQTQDTQSNQQVNQTL